MQDINTVSTAARLLGDRRLRPLGHHPNNQQALKCPRCESVNTKFCYYNNYNLSQPRHFCKNCRRYWTKGGVLRNVPVGGGCRKSKRSSKPKAVKPVHSQSSSDSSNINNNNESGNTISASGCGGLFQISDALDPLFGSTVHQVGDGECDGGRGDVLYPGELAGFMGIMNNNSNHNSGPPSHQHHQDQLSFNGTGTAPFSDFLQSQSTAVGVDQGVQDWGFGKMEGTDDQKIGIDDLLQNRGSSGGLAILDWNHTAENGHQDFFDHQAYWGHSTPTVEHHHHTHWSDNAHDHSLFLP